MSFSQSTVGVGQEEAGPSTNVWANAESVNQLKSIWTKAAEPKFVGSRRGSLGSTSGSSSGTDESRSPPPGYLTNEQKKKGRLLINQVFNGLEYLETDRINYESVLGIVPLIPFRQLLRCSEFDSYAVAQMLSETQRQFDMHVCFLNAMHAELKKAQAKPPLNKHELLWKEIEDDAEKRKIALTGKPSTPVPKSAAEVAKADAEKKVQAFQGMVTAEWEQVLHSIQAAGASNNGGKQFQNLEFMPYHMEKLVKVLENARLGIWLKFSEVQFEYGRLPNKDAVKNNVCIPRSTRERK